MHPLLVEFSKLYDSLDEIEQETVARLIEELNRRRGDIKA